MDWAAGLPPSCTQKEGGASAGGVEKVSRGKNPRRHWWSVGPHGDAPVAARSLALALTMPTEPRTPKESLSESGLQARGARRREAGVCSGVCMEGGRDTKPTTTSVPCTRVGVAPCNLLPHGAPKVAGRRAEQQGPAGEPQRAQRRQCPSQGCSCLPSHLVSAAAAYCRKHLPALQCCGTAPLGR